VNADPADTGPQAAAEDASASSDRRAQERLQDDLTREKNVLNRFKSSHPDQIYVELSLLATAEIEAIFISRQMSVANSFRLHLTLTRV